MISDIYLPIIDGVKLCKLIQSDFPEVQVILMFDDLSNVTQKFLESINVSKAVLKPVDLDLISFEIKRMFSSNKEDKFPVLITEKQEETSILVIDDSSDMHALFKVLLKSDSSLKVTSSLSGAEGINEYKKSSFDYVFIDMNMPEMNGDEALLKIKALDKDYASKFILLTADSTLERESLIKMGFDDYIEKPINKKKILSIVKEIK